MTAPLHPPEDKHGFTVEVGDVVEAVYGGILHTITVEEIHFNHSWHIAGTVLAQIPPGLTKLVKKAEPPAQKSTPKKQETK